MRDTTPDSDVRAAAERLRSASYEPDCDIGSISFEQLSDLLGVKEAYLRDHPADDDEPADLDFAGELLGPLSINGVLFTRSGQLKYDAGADVFILRTRRDVRLLAELLKGSE
jgi:hypothetical protein